MEAAEKRNNDLWSQEVTGRLNCCNDLFAEEAIYHKQCQYNFHLGKPQILIPKSELDAKSGIKSTSSGRPVNDARHASFLQICEWLESQTERYLYSLGELREELLLLAYKEDDVYSVKWMKQKLLDYYGDHINFILHEGRADVVCLNRMSQFLLRQQWMKDKQKDDATESTNIILTAAKLICAELREREYSTDFYPTKSELSDLDSAKNFVPPLLLSFIENLVNDKVKQISICSAIVQAGRPKSAISPLLLGLGVEMDHCYGSKWLIDQLSRFGFSVSSSEVYRYKQSALMSDVTEPSTESRYPTRFTQWIGDNVDHNIASLDGKGSFHGMGIMAVSMSYDKTASRLLENPIKRLKRVPVADSVRPFKFTIHDFFCSGPRGLSSMVVSERKEVEYSLNKLLHYGKLELLWDAGWVFCDSSKYRTSWSGFMHEVSAHEYINHNPVSDVTLLPIVELNPNDHSCILSTLLYVIDQAKLLNVPTPCITFDQPLWLKAVEIAKAANLPIVCRLGGFHMLMSFLGSIGHVMEGSGLEEALKQCYGCLISLTLHQ